MENVARRIPEIPEIRSSPGADPVVGRDFSTGPVRLKKQVDVRRRRGIREDIALGSGTFLGESDRNGRATRRRRQARHANREPN